MTYGIPSFCQREFPQSYQRSANVEVRQDRRTCFGFSFNLICYIKRPDPIAYEAYAKLYMAPEQIDNVDLSKVPGYTPPPGD